MIDRCGTHFGTIMNFLRDGSVPLPETTKGVAELLAEAKYYCITELAESCERALLKKEPEPICRVPLITSQKEEQILIGASTKVCQIEIICKLTQFVSMGFSFVLMCCLFVFLLPNFICAIQPVVKLLINRHNNKYSYTHTSDDNLLKNIELFDKLSLRFSGRILFIKDVIGSNEICCWSFYGNGRKVAEVCCTSIVYATDKKHTKVEFPEARIYEETLQVLLYEDRNAPDQDLLQVTSSYKQVGGGAVGGISTYTSDEEEERSGLARLRLNKQITGT